MKLALALIVTGACASAPPRATFDIALEVKQLGDWSQTTRDRAAKRIRAAIRADPQAAGARDEPYWRHELAANAKPGMTEPQVEAATHASMEGGGSSGESATINYRLDDYWVVQMYFDIRDSVNILREVGTLERRVHAIWVDPPKDFTGRWQTYFANGRLSHDIEYAHGVYVTFTSYFDNGQLVMKQHYVDGKNDGEEAAFHDNGAKAYVGHYAMGKMIGHWTHWFPDGRVETEQDYNDQGELDGQSWTYRPDGSKVRFDYHAGKETGQAAWDEQGVLIYAHDSAADAK
jgi:hypothetical protein